MNNKKSKTSLNGYPEFLGKLKLRIASARLSAVRSINRDMILLYWDIGRGLTEKQRAHGWGGAVIETLASDLQNEYPGIHGFSARNLWNMKRFYLAYSNQAIWRRYIAKFKPTRESTNDHHTINFLLQLVAEIPWGHHLLILDKVFKPESRLYYLQSITRLGWTRNILLNQIKGNAYGRSCKKQKTHNFALVLPENLAEQADEALKSSYQLEFLGIGRAMREREMEHRLLDRIREFILELGYGFCFIGNQYRLTLGSNEYFIDLLFYHRFLKALVAIELKMGRFVPEYAGKMDFYLNLLNEKEKSTDDHPSIGIILCAEKDNLEVEFSLKTKRNPIGVAEYNLVPKLPTKLRGKLPSEKELQDVMHSEFRRVKS